MDVTVESTLDALGSFLERAMDRKWMVWMHPMDVHWCAVCDT